MRNEVSGLVCRLIFWMRIGNSFFRISASAY
jgi:hypothetical protein